MDVDCDDVGFALERVRVSHVEQECVSADITFHRGHLECCLFRIIGNEAWECRSSSIGHSDRIGVVVRVHYVW